VLSIIANLLLLLAANGSGHNIPNETNIAFLITFLVLLLLLGIIIWLIKRSDKKISKDLEQL
jgi:flagellar biogenesis protein FliO